MYIPKHRAPGSAHKPDGMCEAGGCGHHMATRDDYGNLCGGHYVWARQGMDRPVRVAR
jgi:hypothetical protein